jgi:hypothetical protein
MPTPTSQSLLRNIKFTPSNISLLPGLDGFTVVVGLSSFAFIKVALFAQYLPRGTYEYTYLMRASVPGEFLTMPSTAYEMYFPEVFGRSDGGKFTVAPVD